MADFFIEPSESLRISRLGFTGIGGGSRFMISSSWCSQNRAAAWKAAILSLAAWYLTKWTTVPFPTVREWAGKMCLRRRMLSLRLARQQNQGIILFCTKVYWRREEVATPRQTQVFKGPANCSSRGAHPVPRESRETALPHRRRPSEGRRRSRCRRCRTPMLAARLPAAGSVRSCP